MLASMDRNAERSTQRDLLRTGQVAHAAGVNVETLRYYERRGILAEPRRQRSGYRAYSPDAVSIVRFVKRAQDLGFTLAEIEDLLALRESEGRACSEVRAVAHAKIDEIDHKLTQLRAMRRALAKLVATCDAGAAARACPILEALDDRTPKRGRS
jgi:Hg(II)-responsive transcriptional regulator